MRDPILIAMVVLGAAAAWMLQRPPTPAFRAHAETGVDRALDEARGRSRPERTVELRVVDGETAELVPAARIALVFAGPGDERSDPLALSTLVGEDGSLTVRLPTRRAPPGTRALLVAGAEGYADAEAEIDLAAPPPDPLTLRLRRR